MACDLTDPVRSGTAVPRQPGVFQRDVAQRGLRIENPPGLPLALRRDERIFADRLAQPR